MPGTLFWDVKETVVGVLPVVLVPVYAIPKPLKDIETEFSDICVKVIGEPSGVHTLPTALEEQSPTVPDTRVKRSQVEFNRPAGHAREFGPIR